MYALPKTVDEKNMVYLDRYFREASKKLGHIYSAHVVISTKEVKAVLPVIAPLEVIEIFSETARLLEGNKDFLTWLGEKYLGLFGYVSEEDKVKEKLKKIGGYRNKNTGKTTML